MWHVPAGHGHQGGIRRSLQQGRAPPGTALPASPRHRQEPSRTYAAGGGARKQPRRQHPRPGTSYEPSNDAPSSSPQRRGQKAPQCTDVSAISRNILPPDSQPPERAPRTFAGWRCLRTFLVSCAMRLFAFEGPSGSPRGIVGRWAVTVSTTCPRSAGIPCLFPVPMSRVTEHVLSLRAFGSSDASVTQRMPGPSKKGLHFGKRFAFPISRRRSRAPDTGFSNAARSVVFCGSNRLGQPGRPVCVPHASSHHGRLPAGKSNPESLTADAERVGGSPESTPTSPRGPMPDPSVL